MSPMHAPFAPPLPPALALPESVDAVIDLLAQHEYVCDRIGRGGDWGHVFLRFGGFRIVAGPDQHGGGGHYVADFWFKVLGVV